MKVVWTEPAIADLEQLHEYIARDSAMYASRFVGKIILAVEQLAHYPLLGRAVHEASDEGIREILFHGYRITYRKSNRRIELLAIIHGGRDLWGPGPKPWEVF